MPVFTESDLHIVTGLLLPIWKRLPNEHCRVNRLQTDSGERIMGRTVSLAWVAAATDTGVAAISAPEAWSAVLDGRSILMLQDGMQLRRVKVMGTHRVELMAFTDGMVDRLKTFGLMSEIIAWKLRLFVPTGANGPDVLAALLARHPLTGIETGARNMNAPSPAARLSQQLAQNVEAVCRHYLSNGRRQGRYWLVGDADNHPGRSLYVRLKGPDSGKGAAGKWTDAATGEHGDLLDLIARNRHLDRLRDVLDEARAFLSLPQPNPSQWTPHRSPVPQGSPESAQRLFAMSKPLHGSLAEAYLRGRAITHLVDLPALRFHPRCYYRLDADADTQTWPALIAAVTDLRGAITGVHRTWLNPSGRARLPSRRHAVRWDICSAMRCASAQRRTFSQPAKAIETMLSLRDALPDLAMAAGLSANHLAAMLLPSSLRVLYIVRDADAAGDGAVSTLTQRARHEGIEARMLSPLLDDFNDDLRAIGLDQLRRHLSEQLAPEHVARFLGSAGTR